VSKLKGYLSACALAVLWANAACAKPPHFSSLASFNNTNGAFPWAPLALGTDGNFYGTTQNGGTNTCSGGLSCGTIFTVTPAGTLTTLVNLDVTTGDMPYAGLVQGANGNFFGVGSSGGNTSNPNFPGGMGTVFEVTPTGTLTVLHTFSFTDGAIPTGGLMLASDGNFYGTTDQGGVGGLGTIFRLTPTGTLTTLWNFDYGQYGAFPNSALVQTKAGDFYGTAFGGFSGAGVAYKLTANGHFKVVHQFNGTSDGGSPYAGLLVGSDGNLYGATETGGKYVGYGTIFKMTPTGHLKVLHNFDVTDGDVPNGTLMQGTDGNFYGTTAYGGTSPYWGTVFKLTPTGKLTTLHSFDLTDGAFVYAGLIQAPNGTLYGDTFGGGSSTACGAYGCGTIFSLTLDPK
jgi:uncharacterized repeat protein (TIGR03803 family)